MRVIREFFGTFEMFCLTYPGSLGKIPAALVRCGSEARRENRCIDERASQWSFASSSQYWSNSMRFGFVLIVACLLLGPMGYAQELYVNNDTGNDGYDGKSATPMLANRGPFRTIGRALRRASAGDRIHIENTGIPYRESLTLQANRHSGVEGNPFVILGNRAILDGSMPIPPESWEPFRDDIYRFRSENKHFKVIYLGSKPARRSQVEDPRARVLSLEPLQWTLSGGYVYFRAEPGKFAGDYDLNHTVLPVGLTLYEVEHVVVQDLTIQGFHLDGVNAHDGARHVDLVGLVCRGNGRSGISIGGASRVRLEACLVGDNGRAQVRTEGFSHTSIVNCDLIDHPDAPALLREGGEVTKNQIARQPNLGNPRLGSSPPGELPTVIQRR
jgi:hypothetical protein